MQNYFIFLDYLELRRRIEKRLTHPLWLAIHAALFAITTTGFSIYINQQMIRYSSIPNIRIAFYVPETLVVTGWAVLLMVHALRNYARSGASAGVREQMVADEIQKRLENDDSHLTHNPRNLFRLHGLLEKDIQQRSSHTALIILFAVCNGLGWSLWAVTNVLGLSGESAIHYPWDGAPLLGLFFLLLLILNLWWQVGHNDRIKAQVATLDITEDDELEMPKSGYRLALNDEIIELQPEVLNGKRKRGEHQQ